LAKSRISDEELKVIRRLCIDGVGIRVFAHAPQPVGCHTFEFTRGVLPGETLDDAFARVKPEILQLIVEDCGRSCTCDNGQPAISFRRW
jgi:hypothetical protein